MTKPAPTRPRPSRKGRRRAPKGPRGTEYRRVFPVGHSLAVTLPPACLRLLGVQRGGSVQVVPWPSGKVVIAPMRLRVGAERELVSAVRDLAVMRHRVERLKRKLAARPLRVLNEGMSLGWTQASTARFHDLDRLLNWVRALTLIVATEADGAGDPPAAPPPGSPDS